jgi:hypothetical protein
MIRALTSCCVAVALTVVALSYVETSAQAPVAVGDAHLKQNALYRELRSPGIRVGANASVPLPPPLMPDGLDGDRQMAVMAAVVKDSHPVEEFLRDAVDAPFVVRVFALDAVEPGSPVRRFSVAWVVYGSLDRVVEPAFRERFVRLIGRGDVELHELTDIELARRKIIVPKGQTEFYTNYNIPLFDRVQLSETKHNVQTRSSESVIIASLLDSRFLDDLIFPNTWQRVAVQGDGDVTFGAPQRYTGAASYLKLTRLAKVPNAMFGEFHVAYTEPSGWFNGTNFMSSKIPILARTEVHGLRRELSRMKAPATQP